MLRAAPGSRSAPAANRPYLPRAQVLAQLAAEGVVDVHVAVVTKHETGAAEDDGYYDSYKRRRRCCYYDDWDEEEEEEEESGPHSMVEVGPGQLTYHSPLLPACLLGSSPAASGLTALPRHRLLPNLGPTVGGACCCTPSFQKPQRCCCSALSNIPHLPAGRQRQMQP